LREGYKDGFDLGWLDTVYMMSTSLAINYCRDWLGEELSFGDARFVFLLNDKMVLKLDVGNGCEQNRLEYMHYVQTRSPLLTRVFACGDGYHWIICERANVAREEDFEMFLGIPYDKEWAQVSDSGKDRTSVNGGDWEVGFDGYFDSGKHYHNEPNDGLSVDKLLCYMIDKSYGYRGAECTDEFVAEADSLIESHPWFRGVYRLICKYNLYDLHLGNFGIVNRDGNPLIVILDSSF
jgi:hypothetical protein